MALESSRSPLGSSGAHSAARLLSVDVLRGLTVAGMILVTDPGTYAHRFAVLCHADWNGPTATDIIFPSFLVTVGISMVLSFSTRMGHGASLRSLLAHSLRRGGWLLLIGLLLNGFPYYHLRSYPIPGILQLIAGAYVFAAGTYLALLRSSLPRMRRVLTLLLITCAVLTIYGLLLRFYPTPGFGPGHLDTRGSLPAVIDRAVFTPAHMWAYGLTPGYGVTYDPNGLLLLLPTCATVLFGGCVGEVLRSSMTRPRQCGSIATLGMTLWLLGLGLSPWLVLNKKLWTSTFALFSTGLAMLVFAALLYLIDIRGIRRGWTLALIFGTNAILAFTVSTVVTSLLSAIHVHGAGQSSDLHAALYQHLFAIGSAPKLGSLLYAIAIVLLNAALLFPLYRRRLFLRL